MLRMLVSSLRRSILALVALAIVVLVSADFARAAEPDFKAMINKVGDAWETLDPAKAGIYYSKDASAVYFDIAPLKYTGWDAYATGTKDVFQNFSSLAITMNDDVKIDRHGDLAITTVTGRADVVDKSGAKQSLECRWTLVWEKQKDTWLISHEHLSTPLAMPTMPEQHESK